MKMFKYWQEHAERQEARINDLVAQIKNVKTEPNVEIKKNNLPAIDVKDVKKPEEYDGDEKTFSVWYSRFRGLLINRHESWKGIFEVVENFKEVIIENPDGQHKPFKKKSDELKKDIEDPGIYAVRL